MSHGYYPSMASPMQYVDMNTAVDDLNEAGIWWIASGIMDFFGDPRIVILLALMIGSYVNIFLVLSLLVPGLVTAIIYIITMAMTMRLSRLESTLKGASIVSLVGLGLGIASLVIYIVAFLLGYYYGYWDYYGNYYPGSYCYTLSLIGYVLYIVSSILLLVGGILLVIGFYRIGSNANVSLLTVGAILAVFVPMVGSLLIGIGLRKVSSELQVVGLGGFDWNAIKDDINSLLANKQPINIKFYAMQKMIFPLALKIKVQEWIFKNEIKAFIMKDMILPR